MPSLWGVSLGLLVGSVFTALSIADIKEGMIDLETRVRSLEADIPSAVEDMK